MARSKAKELNPNPQRTSDSSCPVCHPVKKGYVREDQVWGVCPTNKLHMHQGGK